ncbi:hypothetical protein THRCLA_04826 [Thraustotheca clavata]|uniref:FYVE-type domain-containing protein n=1 Tax=Thraustotheca clavata TaxID=74557 RepID=A0A1V9ZXU5_9STRA|nr:hypothetical protein THRCLA_04826 [Thraustotheca clavata]
MESYRIFNGQYKHLVQYQARHQPTESRTKYQYPVPETIFDCPPLSQEEEAAFIAKGEKAFKTFLDSVLKRDASFIWNFVGDYDGIRLMEGDIPGFKLEKPPYRAFGKITATLEEIAYLHAFETRDKCDFYRKHHAQDLLDMFPLYSFFERTPARPLKQMYIKWSALSSPVPIIKNRDFVFIEAQDEFRLSSGRRGWAFCQYSVDVPGVCHLQDSPLNLVRGSVSHMGCAYIETDIPGVLDAIYHISSDLKGAIPHWVRKIGMKHRARHLAHLNEYVRKARLNSRYIIPKPHSWPAPTSQRCTICDQLKGYQQIASCHSCGEVVCTRCSRKKLNLSKADTNERERICNNCLRKVRRDSLSDGSLSCPTPNSEASSESSTSLARFSYRSSSVGGGSDFDAIDAASVAWPGNKARQNSDPAAVDLSYVNAYGENLRKTKSLPLMTQPKRVVLFDPTAFQQQPTPVEDDDEGNATVIDESHIDSIMMTNR